MGVAQGNARPLVAVRHTNITCMSTRCEQVSDRVTRACGRRIKSRRSTLWGLPLPQTLLLLSESALLTWVLRGGSVIPEKSTTILNSNPDGSVDKHKTHE